MNVLVTGSNGFIGTHVCRYLKEKGMYVIVWEEEQRRLQK